MSDRIAVMDHGRIVQLGTPVDLYDRPNSRFVASFIGESNFLDGVAVGQSAAGVVHVQAGGATVKAMGQTDVNAGSNVVIAVRPEKLSVRDGGDGTADIDLNHLTAKVREGTFIGEMRRYVVQTDDGITMTLKQPLRFGIPNYAPGDRVELTWHVEDTRIVSVDEV